MLDITMTVPQRSEAELQAIRLQEQSGPVGFIHAHQAEFSIGMVGVAIITLTAIAGLVRRLR